MANTLDWHGDNAMKFVQEAAWINIQRATVYLWQQCMIAVGVSNPKPYLTPSKPGEPPRKRTGWLQRHILYDIDTWYLVGRVGVAQNAMYGLFLDMGTVHMGARPWLMATVKKIWPQLQAIAGGAAQGTQP